MSLILDALNRSRQDSDAVPGLGSEHFAERSFDVRPYAPWLALLLAVLVIIWLLVGDRPAANDEASGGVDVAAPTVQPTQKTGTGAVASTAAKTTGPGVMGKQKQVNASPTTTRVKAPANKEIKPGPPEKPQAPQVASVNRPVAGATVAAKTAPVPQAQARARPKSSKAPGVSASDRAALEALYAQSRQAKTTKVAAGPSTAVAAEPAATARDKAKSQGKNTSKRAAAPAPVVREDSVDVEEVLRLAQEEVANARLQEHSAPFLVGLSQQVKNDIPSIMYQRHDYSTAKGQSKVTLNGKSLRVGGVPLAGMRVDEILEDSVVLTYKGTQFRLRALNSWVNL